MSRRKTRTAAVLSGFELQVTTTQTIALDVALLDPEMDYVKQLDVRLLKIDATTLEPTEVGTASGVIVLGALAAEEGSSTEAVCDAFSGDLLATFHEAQTFTRGRVSSPDMAYVDELEILPAHDDLILRTVLFEQVVRTLGVPVEYVTTWCENFKLERDTEPPANWGVHLPGGSNFFADTGVVIWESDRIP